MEPVGGRSTGSAGESGAVLTRGQAELEAASVDVLVELAAARRDELRLTALSDFWPRPGRRRWGARLGGRGALRRATMPSSLDAILRPRSVAVVGAARRRGSIAAEVFRNLMQTGFRGAVYPVNPNAQVVQSVRAYPRVEDIPDEVDLAVVVVPAAQVLEAVESCGRKGVRGMVIISAGFAETGAEGALLQAQVVERARGYGMRVVGPNCLGVLNADPDVALDATFAPTFPPFGNVAFSSQSGALGLAILDVARELGVGISSFVSMGNKADVSADDLLSYWENDPATQVILLYLENLGDPVRFLESARRVSRKKPIAVLKSGRTEAGRRAASSHTGALAGLDVAVDALLGQCGVVRADTIHELFDVAKLLANQPVPRGKRVAILTNAGGPGIMASDACESRGLTVAPLSAETQAALRAFLPREAAVSNPVDMIASASAVDYERALSLVLADPAVDAALILFVTPIVTAAEQVASAVLRASSGTDKTLATCFMGKHGVPEATAELRGKQVPTYAFPEQAAAAMAAAARYGAYLARDEGAVPSLVVDRARAKAALGAAASEGAWLSPAAVRELLSAYGIRSPRQEVARSADEAALLAEGVGFPLVLKLVSSTIAHKTDVGGVVLGLTSPEAVREAYASIERELERRGRSSEMQGALLQEMVPGGIETFVGATRDPAFGHLVAFGIGGVNVELWKDVVFRVSPIRDVEAAEMIDAIRARALLEGFRGSALADKSALADVLLRVSQLVADFPRVVEIDINPLVALPSGAIALDARVRLGKAG